MARGLTTAQKTYRGPRYWLLDVTTRAGVQHFYWGNSRGFGDGDRVMLGQTYQPRLRVTEGIRRTKSLVVSGGAFELDNADGAIETLLEGGSFNGALGVLRQYLVGIDSAVEELRGILTEQSLGRMAASWRLRPEVEPSRIATPRHYFDPLCQWTYNQASCGNLRGSLAVTVELAERTSTGATTTTITDSTLAETVNAHVDRFCAFTSGAKKGSVRRVKSNTATVFTFYQPITGLAAGDKFIIVSAAAGLPKLLFTSTSGKFESATATTHTARTIGDSGLAMTVDAHKSDGVESAAGVVVLSAGTGAGQSRRIKSNSATVVTIADDEPDFSPVPDATTKFMVAFRFCPKDVFESCEARGRTHAFSGVPTVSPALARAVGQPNPTRPGGGGGGGTGGGDGRDDGRDLIFL